MFRLAVADLDSPSYFVAIAAVELGFFKEEGVDIELEHSYGARNGPERLRDGSLHFFGGPAYAATRAFPAWQGAKSALRAGATFLLVPRRARRSRRQARRSRRAQGFADFLVDAISGAGAAPPFGGCRNRSRTRQGRIVPPPPTVDGRFMGHAGIDAIVHNLADAFWGNGMRVAIGEHRGIAKLHLDLRRGDGPPGARSYNFAALTTTERLIEEHPEIAAGAVRAIVKAQAALKAEPSRATAIAGRCSRRRRCR